jgi:hypothetical protein
MQLEVLPGFRAFFAGGGLVLVSRERVLNLAGRRARLPAKKIVAAEFCQQQLALLVAVLIAPFETGLSLQCVVTGPVFAGDRGNRPALESPWRWVAFAPPATENSPVSARRGVRHG